MVRFPSRSTLNTSDFSRLSRAHFIHSKCDIQFILCNTSCLAKVRYKPKRERYD